MKELERKETSEVTGGSRAAPYPGGVGSTPPYVPVPLSPDPAGGTPTFDSTIGTTTQKTE